MNDFLNSTVQRVYGLTDKAKDAVTAVRGKMNKLYGEDESEEAPKNVDERGIVNPFLKKDGSLVNPYINYQKVLDNPNVSSVAKDFITSATKLTPTSAGNDVQASSYEDYTKQSGADNITVNVNSSDGVFKNSELLGIIKRVSKETSVPTNVLLAVAQQETNGKWYDSVPDGTGKSYGYMMLYDNGVIADLKAKGQSELAEKAKIDPYTNVLVGAQYLMQNYQKYGDWQKAAAKYNGAGAAAEKYGATVWSRANSQTYIDAANSLNYGSSGGSKVVDTAKQFLGTPYVWGGTSPKGFDCSGLMQYAMAKNGVNIPRTSQAQFKSGQAVEKSQLEPGDLVFFKSSSGTATAPGHVGMYIGNGQYIHAPQTGDVVKISNISSRKDYVGARRYTG